MRTEVLVVCTIVGLSLFALAISRLLRILRSKYWSLTKGTVVEVGSRATEGGYYLTVKVKYRVEEIEYITEDLNPSGFTVAKNTATTALEKTPRIGSTVDVFFDIKDPGKSALSKSMGYFGPIFLGLLGLAFSLTPFVMNFWVKK